jgi:hypothetical protein
MRDNKLIANFMFEETMPINQMRYHSSWDWLMPVANEIIKSRDEQNADWDLNDLKYALCTTNIEYVYKAVVEFIKDQKQLEIMNVEQAKEVLRKEGYFVDNLWNVSDVKHKYICDEDTAQDILYKSLTNDATMEQIWLSIDIFSEDLQPTNN